MINHNFRAVILLQFPGNLNQLAVVTVNRIYTPSLEVLLVVLEDDGGEVNYY